MRLLAVNVEIEVLVVDLFVLAVSADRCNGCAELVGQCRVALTNRDASALAVDFFINR